MQEKGILFPVSSLPGKYGIGDFSNEAYDFIRLLKKNNINVWQILPLNPIGYGHSPYQSFSSYAFDEIYISLNDLKRRGYISKYVKVPQVDKINYEKARIIKEKAINRAYINFSKEPKNKKKIDDFIKDNPLIFEYAKFITLKELNNSNSWDNWIIFENDKKDEFTFNVRKHIFAQLIMSEEWQKIKDFANSKNIKIMGDIPFYVGYDSSDVYFHKESFYLDDHDKPTCIAGVPPDYFSEYGQRWGNPIFNWEYLYKTNFKMLIERIGFASKLYDIIRLDHFRAFDSYWSINPNCLTAIDGEWKYPDGRGFLKALFSAYPNIKIVAEDLGELRPEVYELRDAFNLPGMRNLQFTIFDDEIFDKRVEKENMFYYSSTHDNETLNEWVNKRTEDETKQLISRLNELKIRGNNLVEKLINYSLTRKEKCIILNATDILPAEKTHRINIPGEINDTNWTFKLTSFNELEKSINKFLK